MTALIGTSGECLFSECSTSTIGCLSPLSAADVFKDVPWFNVPLYRRAEITIEPLLPRGRLFGGSSDGVPKVSRLAALAAARRKKENEKANIPGSKNPPSKSIALLDKLTGTYKPYEEVANKSMETVKSAPSTPKQESDTLSTSQSHKVPLSKRKSHSPSKPIDPLGQAILEPEMTKETQGIPAPIIDTPSPFARAMLGPTLSNRSSPKASKLSPFLGSFYVSEMNHAELNNFTGPSPDDVVAAAQNSKGSLKAENRSRRRRTNFDRL